MAVAAQFPPSEVFLCAPHQVHHARRAAGPPSPSPRSFEPSSRRFSLRSSAFGPPTVGTSMFPTRTNARPASSAPSSHGRRPSPDHAASNHPIQGHSSSEPAVPVMPEDPFGTMLGSNPARESHRLHDHSTENNAFNFALRPARVGTSSGARHPTTGLEDVVPPHVSPHQQDQVRLDPS